MNNNNNNGVNRGNVVDNIHNPNATTAIHEASTAAEYANTGRKHRSVFYNLRDIVSTWNDLLVNDPVTMFTTIFVICFAADILVAWEMYRDVVSYVLPTTPTWAMFLLGVLINGFAAIVSHLFSKSKSDGLFNYEVWNLQHLTNKGEKPYEVAVREITKDKKNDLILFWGCFVILLAIVGLASFNRSSLLSAAGQTQADYNWLQKILPIVIVIAEVFTGIYLFFVIKRLNKKLKASIERNKFLKNLHLTNEHDKIVGRLIQNAQDKGEHIDFQRNVKNALYRLQFRDLDDKYIDEMDFNQAEFIVKNLSNNSLANIRIIGNLDGGGVTNPTYTDEEGKATIHWQTAAENILILQVGGIDLRGPFAKNQTHIVRLQIPPSPSITTLIN